MGDGQLGLRGTGTAPSLPLMGVRRPSPDFYPLNLKRGLQIVLKAILQYYSKRGIVSLDSWRGFIFDLGMAL